MLRSFRIDTVSLSCSVRASSAPSEETIRHDSLFSSAYHSRDYQCLWRLRSIETQSPPLSSLVPGDTTEYGLSCLNCPSLACIHAIEEARTWYDSNRLTERPRAGFQDRYRDRGYPDGIELPSIPGHTASAGAFASVKCI